MAVAAMRRGGASGKEGYAVVEHAALEGRYGGLPTLHSRAGTDVHTVPPTHPPPPASMGRQWKKVNKISSPLLLPPPALCFTVRKVRRDPGPRIQAPSKPRGKEGRTGAKRLVSARGVPEAPGAPV